MSAAPRYPTGLSYAGLRMTANQFYALGETRDRYELVDGVIVMSPSPSLLHQNILRAILRQLETYADRTAGLQIAVEVDLELSRSLVYQPDLAVYRPGRLKGMPRRLKIAPDLAVEILSPGSRAMDLLTKREDYGRHGVGEYWTVDQANGRLRRWMRRGARFAEARGVEDDRVASSALPGFVLDLRPIRALARRGS